MRVRPLNGRKVLAIGLEVGGKGELDSFESE